jgi:hypothetical protein
MLFPVKWLFSVLTVSRKSRYGGSTSSNLPRHTRSPLDRLYEHLFTRPPPCFPLPVDRNKILVDAFITAKRVVSLCSHLGAAER